MEKSFDTIIVGTGFASSFFLLEYLKHARIDERILVLEKGEDIPYQWKLENQVNTNANFGAMINNLTPQKIWIQNIAFGGGSCWTGNTPRMHPSDFNTFSKHGVGEDWPLSYEEFDPYVTEVEYLMGIAGDNSNEYPRTKPYPMPGHKLNAFDRLLVEKYGDRYTAMPSARASDFSKGRPKCCNNGVCSVCPIGAKFQIDLHMRELYKDPRVTLINNCSVDRLDIRNNVVQGVVCQLEGKEAVFKSNFTAVGAHALMTPYILMKSGIEQYALGRYLSEQVGIDVSVNLNQVENLDGGQRVTGLGTMFIDESNRGEAAGCLVEGYNIPWLRAEFGKWRHVSHFKFVFEDIPQPENRVTVGENNKPDISFAKMSDYMKNGIAELPRRVEELLSGLPVEDYHIDEKTDDMIGSSAHIQGTTRMGLDPDTSVVDPSLLHHQVRNLAVLGSGAFPTCAAANPTLILSALSIKSARDLFS